MAVVPYVRATHSDGQSWSAAKANLLEAGCNDLSYAPAVRVTHNATQSITNATETTLAFNTERFDQAGNAADTMHDTVTNNNRLTCRYAGIYQITASIEWSASPVANSFLKIRNQAAVTIALQGIGSGTVDNRYVSVATLWNMAVNDWVEVRVFQSSGGSINITSSTSYSPEFMMVRVA